MFARFAKTYQKGDIIFCEYEPGDTFYLIQSGRVEILKIMDDMQKTLDILEPGELFGEMAILEEAPRSATALAMDKVVALEFNRENFEVLMQGNPQIALKLLKLFTKRIYDQKRRFMILTLDDPEARVADVFLMLGERQRVNPEETDSVELEATVDDIAHWAGMSPGQCKEVINHFVAQRRVDLFENRILIKNINDFSRFVRARRRAEEME
jgi:CRP-like cAMP-binding protein